MTGPFTITSLGLQVPLLAPRPHDIQLRDIAHQLALINRFSGATMFPYSVAQHSVLVANLLLPLSPRHALLGLVHDAHEAYLGEMITPVKTASAQINRQFVQPSIAPQPRELLECGFDVAIHARFGIEPPDEKECQAIALMDEVALATEWRDLMPDVPCPVASPPDRYPVKALRWEKAEQKFLDTFDRLTRLAGVPGHRNVPTGIVK